MQAEINRPKDVGTYIAKIAVEGRFLQCIFAILFNKRQLEIAINLTTPQFLHIRKMSTKSNPHPVISIEESTILKWYCEIQC